MWHVYAILSWRSPLTRMYRSSHSIQTSKPLLKSSSWPSRKVCTNQHSDTLYFTRMCFTENWEPKGKFPPGIRPVLGAVALKAIRLNEYNDNFFNLMPRIFPYNRFTMSVRFGPLLPRVSPLMYVECRNLSSVKYSPTTWRFY